LEQASTRLLPEEEVALFQLARRRIDEHIPVPFLTNKAWFAGLSFYVDERVHIPRSPFAEWIAKGFLPWCDQEKVFRVLDLCTGSGSLAIACAYAFPHALVDAVELSASAAAVAQINVERHELPDRVRILQGDLWHVVDGQYDLIISNPPYVNEAEMQTLPQEYDHEPRMALAAGDAGLDIVEHILKQAKQYLKPGGLLAVEVGNTAEIMETVYPRLPFIWLDCAWGGGGVFVLQEEDL
jgi:ribosomal protein L3 glutamine methyltransferase